MSFWGDRRGDITPRRRAIARRMVTAVWGGALVVVVAAVPIGLRSQAGGPQAGTAAQLMDAPHDTGQTISPVYEGWEPNTDGTVSMYFGYMNRNWKEELDIPIGPNNSFSPGQADRGQPTHFLPRRRKQIFAIVVPKDFKQTLTWTVTVRGDTERVPGSLKPEQQIDVHKDTQTGNTPPKVTLIDHIDASVGMPVTLSVGVTDDGLPKPSRRGGAGGLATLHVSWSKYRGVGKIKFSSDSTQVKDGTATTTAMFSEPGTYVVQALADDGSVYLTSQGQNVPGYGCCWTPANITVTVK
jgi:hypothetical protein